MRRFNKILIVSLVVLLLVACVTSIGAVDLEDFSLNEVGGSGSVSDDDGSASDGSSYDDKSNVGSADSQDELLEDPLDEEYYSSSSSSSSSNDGGFSVSLLNHATGIPFFIFVLAFLSIGGIWIRR